MRNLILIISITFLTISCKKQLSNSSMWEKSKEKPISSQSTPTSFQVFEMKKEQVSEILMSAGIDKETAKKISLPDPDGVFKDFYIWKSSTVSPELLKKFPNLQTYQGVATDSETTRIRLENPDTGLRVMVIEDSNVWYILPDQANPKIYLTYYKKNLPAGIKNFWSDKIINEK